MKNFFAFLFLMLLLGGCTTTTTYTPSANQNSKQDSARESRPDDYPIPIYTENMTAPRPCNVIGKVKIDATRFTEFGGSLNSEMKKVLAKAHKVGADAVQIQSVKKPDYANTNYRLTANLLAYADDWEKISFTSAEFANYLKTHQAALDPIEGVWDARGMVPHHIGIVRDSSKPGREFVGFILGSENPAWSRGCKKMDIARGLQPNSYKLTYYLENFGKRETTIILNQNFSFTLAITKSDSENNNADYVTYYKNW